MQILTIHAANPGPFTGTGNWTYLIPGGAAVLIDAGVGQRRHLDEIGQAAPRGLSQVLVTHAHADHASGATAIRERWPSVRFAKRSWPERDSAVDVRWRPLADGSRIPTSQGTLEAVATPGHSPDHLAFWHAESRTVFVGDLLVQGSTVVIPASGGGSLVDYLASLQRLARLQPRRALPAHGPVIEDPLALIAHYIEHRRHREAQVMTALAQGPRTVAAIAEAIYSALTPALMPMARESVLAHLSKLEIEGRARRDGEQWRLV